MKTASQLREEASNAGDFIDKYTVKLKEYIDSKIENAAKKGLYFIKIYSLVIVDDMSLRDKTVEHLISYYQNLGFSIYIDTNLYYPSIEISWKETLWQKFKKIWSKK